MEDEEGGSNSSHNSHREHGGSPLEANEVNAERNSEEVGQTETKAAMKTSEDKKEEKKERILWDPTGRDAKTIERAKKLKEEGDSKFKRSLFEDAMQLYSDALVTLSEDIGYEEERLVCLSNRAACGMQVRDYSQVVRDCSLVLEDDEKNLKALARRCLAYEGLEKFARAAEDARTVLSIEYASGAPLSALGMRVKDCLQRCKRLCPELEGVKIPLLDPKSCTAGGGSGSQRAAQQEVAKTARSSETKDDKQANEEARRVKPEEGRKGGKAAEEGRSNKRVIEEDTSKEKEEGKGKKIEEEGKGKKVEEEGKGKKIEEEGKGKKVEEEGKGKKVEAEGRSSKWKEAEDSKVKGNLAFKAGKYQLALMHYCAAIELVGHHPTYSTNLAATYLALKDYENARVSSEAAMAVDASYPKAFYRHAQALEGLGRLPEALETIEKGLRLLPESEQMKEMKEASDGRDRVSGGKGSQED
ncbi:hypothetical protein GUITHDRAFT_83795 [Guillardia theta CCMP2712]|uniref:Uncharacterized protein n=1 Tax=Guillardia theta (strain CCMP2712) TaxID=905079 RepID=L1K3Z0_GUITC|nr:hypothetical protein GUITHDRAFT_83795 [Guillardia theta CCMP2712]EKX55546.1 hypothetical protein GUITHDRAFT_83795 [Guillardia theta CCMP2712]|eukprot:XP_005842526.1 hypothetical protein GUITHDRAFT_83795 [Guillardia theta CCMP2712]